MNVFWGDYSSVVSRGGEYPKIIPFNLSGRLLQKNIWLRDEEIDYFQHYQWLMVCWGVSGHESQKIKNPNSRFTENKNLTFFAYSWITVNERLKSQVTVIKTTPITDHEKTFPLLSNGDPDPWPTDLKINRFLSLSPPFYLYKIRSNRVRDAQVRVRKWNAE